MSTTNPIPDSRPLTPDSRFPTPDPWRLTPDSRIAAWQRAMLLFAGLVLVSLLITAAILSPNRRGMGTHQQLGLPPCSFVIWFNMRCPACGMTTSWSHLMRGQIVQSMHANTGGMLLALLAIAGAPWMLISAMRGRWWISDLSPVTVLVGGGIVFFVSFAQWVWRVFL